MIGHSAAIAAARTYSSTVGSSPENPARSHPQNATPLTAALSPAVIEARNAGQVESSSPAQWHGARTVVEQLRVGLGVGKGEAVFLLGAAGAVGVRQRVAPGVLAAVGLEAGD